MIKHVEGGLEPQFAVALAEATWSGDADVLPVGERVEVLAVDPAARYSRQLGWSGVPARTACWIRCWPSYTDYALYRSCDLADLDLIDGDFARLIALLRPSEGVEP